MDSCITTQPSLTLVRATWTRQNGLVHLTFVLRHLCCYSMAFCLATLPSKSLILANESVGNSSSIDGTRRNIGFFALSLQHHQSHHASTDVSTIAWLLSGILLLCLLRTFTIFGVTTECKATHFHIIDNKSCYCYLPRSTKDSNQFAHAGPEWP